MLLLPSHRYHVHDHVSYSSFVPIVLIVADDFDTANNSHNLRHHFWTMCFRSAGVAIRALTKDYNFVYEYWWVKYSMIYVTLYSLQDSILRQ